MPLRDRPDGPSPGPTLSSLEPSTPPRATRRTARGDAARGTGRGRASVQPRPCARRRRGRRSSPLTRSPNARRSRGSTRKPVRPSSICSRMPPIPEATTGRPFHIASATVRPKPSARLFCATTSARRCRALTITAFSSASSIGSSARCTRRRSRRGSSDQAVSTSREDLGALGVVGHSGHVGAGQHAGAAPRPA